MKESFQNLLINYKQKSFKLYHETKDVKEDLLKEVNQISKEILSQKFHYTFHKEPNKERAEVFNMIYNFTTEALLPPILDKMIERIVILEKRHEMLLDMVIEGLEVLSEDKKIEEIRD